MIVASAFEKRIFTGLVLTALFVASYLWLPPFFLTLLLLTILGVILFVEWPRIGISALTPWYPILPFILLIVLNHSYKYRNLLPTIFIIAAAFDAGSYFAGTWMGKCKLAPRISPGKTWEGALGGAILSLIATLLLIPSLRVKHAWCAWFGIVLGIDVAALLGDLFVSWLKRRAGVKDCSSILPGHGGLLDRFDSILFVTLFLYCLRSYV
ncbi:MAG: phosphatidate cytidylyltransferase [Candidatus Babeliaceae bacterium]|nr:phosphatidate cytidylyltransferase [Candidatus Babeliaceae bacterium]